MLMLAASWLTSFRPFTTFHLVIAVVGLLAIAAVCIAGRRLRGTPHEPRFRLFLAAFIVIEQIAAYATWFLADPIQWEDRIIPLHPCRIVVWIAALALVTQRRAPRALTYFLALGLCCQPILTPPKLDGLASADFWFFWISHLMIVCAAAYDLAVHGFRPTVRDPFTALIVSLVYIAIVLPLDHIFGWDYGYLGHDIPKTRTVIEYLGPWPWRLVALSLIAFAVMSLLLVIWHVPPLRRRAALPVATTATAP